MIFLDWLDTTRKRGVPLLSVTTPDSQDTIKKVVKFIKEEACLFCWDCVEGLFASNKKAAAQISKIIPDNQDSRSITARLEDCLVLLSEKMPNDSIVMCKNAHLFLGIEPVIQSISNLRDRFKSSGRTLILLSPGLSLPQELKFDFLCYDEALPNRDEVGDIVKKTYSSFVKQIEGLPNLSDELFQKIVPAVQGVSGFNIEQILALCTKKDGLDLGQVRENKYRFISDIPGLSVYQGTMKYSDIHGYDNAKNFILKLSKGIEAPNSIIFLDEIDKDLAGSGDIGDTSGVSQDLLGELLKYMEGAKGKAKIGIIFIGLPGSGKSAIAMSSGNEIDIPTISFSVNECKDSLVGESGKRMRTALKVIDSISNERPLFICTCNSVKTLRPEFRRRFALEFFFDLPDEEQRKGIWKIHLKVNDISLDSILPKNYGEGWTGAEIRNCCRYAKALKIPILDDGECAANYIVPVSISSSSLIKKMREEAHKKFLDANKIGIYEIPGKKQFYDDNRKIKE